MIYYEDTPVLAALIVIACVNIFFRQVNRALNKHCSGWTHLSGGFAVGYVFLYLMPKTAFFSGHPDLQVEGFTYLGSTVTFFFMLFGFICYWVVDLNADIESKASKRTNLHVSGYMAYNLLVGYVISSTVSMTALALPIAAFAMMLHLAGLNHLLHHWAPKAFNSYFRWLLTLALFSGGLTGLLIDLPVWAIAFLTAFTGGAILINVVYYELPRHNKGSIKPFVLGVTLFATLCIIIRYLHYFYSSDVLTLT